MAIQRLDHVGVVVEDLAAARDFFVAIGLEQSGEGAVGGSWVDAIIGLEGAQSDVVMLTAPNGGTSLELTRFRTPTGPGLEAPAPSNTPGLRHLCFAVDDLDAVLARVDLLGYALVGSVERYEDVYRLCYVRGPEGVLVELAESLRP